MYDIRVITKQNYEPCISLKELKKRKAKKYYNKNRVSYWVDDKGCFYEADKGILPNKKKIEEYDHFKGNKEAVFVSYGKEVFNCKKKWFDSIEQFLDFFEKEEADFPPTSGTLKYSILKTGYTLIAPDERKIISALPYIDVDKEIIYAAENTANKNAVYWIVARKWIKKMEGIKYFEKVCYDTDWVEDMIKQYVQWRRCLG